MKNIKKEATKWKKMDTNNRKKNRLVEGAGQDRRVAAWNAVTIGVPGALAPLVLAMLQPQSVRVAQLTVVPQQVAYAFTEPLE